MFIICILLTNGYSQQMKNLYDFDEARMHFGFVLGYNKADFYLDKNTEYGTVDRYLNGDGGRTKVRV